MRIPDRAIELSGSEVAEALRSLSGQEREDFVLKQVRGGNVPDFLRIATFITLEGPEGQAVLEVTCDYLCLGTNDDFIYTPVNIRTAQKICDVFGGMLPTRKIVDEIWKQAEVKLDPSPWGPPYDASMASSERFIEQNVKLQAQRKAAGMPLGMLTAGQFKDYILVPELEAHPDRTCIYGWHQKNGRPIQGVQFGAHEATYVDYSQCPRIISEFVYLSDKTAPVASYLSDPLKCVYVSSSGPMNIKRVPGV